MNDKIEEAIKLLRREDYVIFKHEDFWNHMNDTCHVRMEILDQIMQINDVCLRVDIRYNIKKLLDYDRNLESKRL